MFITKDWFIVPDAPGRYFSPSLNKEASYEFICLNYLLCPLEDIGSLLALSKLQVVIEPSLSDCVSIWEFDALSSSISYANEYDAHSTITLTVEKVFTK